MVLSSRVTLAFIAAYSPRMRGNFLRFQAQYLRRIRLPRWEDVGRDVQDALLAASRTDCQPDADESIQRLYHLDDAEWHTLKSKTP